MIGIDCSLYKPSGRWPLVYGWRKLTIDMQSLPKKPLQPNQQLSNRRAAEPASAALPDLGRRNRLWIISGVFLFVIIALVVAGQQIFSGPDLAKPSETQAIAPAPVSKEADHAPGKQPTQETPATPKADEPAIVEDDGKTLWVSPTTGKPLDLAYLSPGAQLIAILRPAAMLAHSEGAKIRAAMGPEGERGIRVIEEATFTPLADMEQLVVGGQVTSAGEWLLTLVVHRREPISSDAAFSKLPAAEQKEYEGTKYWMANGRAYFLPAAANGKVLVVAPAAAMADIIDLAGNTPPLRRDIERLLDETDRERHVTLIVAPNSLFSEGQSIFAGEFTSLRDPLFWFLGDELSGAALSMHWGQDFFLELVATPKLETPPEKASRIFVQRTKQIPEQLQQYVSTLSPQSYSQQVVARLPAMVRRVSKYTRSGYERDHAVLRCYLPLAAGHNLLMAGELTLGQSQGGSRKLGATKTAAADVARSAKSTVGAALLKPTSLRFTKDTLEAALDQLSKDIGVPIVIRGPDLQADGITKNQSFGIDLSNKPAGQILVEILRLANPDKSATGPSDKAQKLVYVIEKTADKTDQIVVTTRAGAAKHKNQLPAIFSEAKP